MPKTSVKYREIKRVRCAEKNRAKVMQLKELAKAVYKGEGDAWELMLAKQNLPRNASRCRVQRRCFQCARPHAVYRKFGLCRICLRKSAMQGFVPGIVKASW